VFPRVLAKRVRGVSCPGFKDESWSGGPLMIYHPRRAGCWAKACQTEGVEPAHQMPKEWKKSCLIDTLSYQCSKDTHRADQTLTARACSGVQLLMASSSFLVNPSPAMG